MRPYLYLLITAVFCTVFPTPNTTQAQTASFLAADAKGAVGETNKLFLIEVTECSFCKRESTII